MSSRVPFTRRRIRPKRGSSSATACEASVRNAAGELWRDRIGSAWVDAYNDSVWIYAAQLAEEAVHMGFAEVQFDYVRFPDEPHERLMTALFPGKHPGENFRAGVRRNVTMLKRRLAPLGGDEESRRHADDERAHREEDAEQPQALVPL